MKTLLLFLTLFFSAFNAQNYTWSPLSDPPSTTGRYDDVFFLNENVGWAARGGSPAVFKTTDGGANWVQQTVSTFTGEYYRNIEFLNENIGFLGTLKPHFYKTTNGGTSWDVVNLPGNPPAICGLDTVGANTVYGCGAWFGPAYIIKSSDQGNTWTFKDMSAQAAALVEILFVDENIGFVSGTSETGAIILKTIDGGENWTTFFSNNNPGDYVWKMQFLNNDPSKMFCSLESEMENGGKLLKTLNGGITFETKDFPDEYVQAVGFVSETNGWMGGHSTGFYETKDGGDTWINTEVGGSLNRIFFIGQTAFASGHNIYKMSERLGTQDPNQIAALGKKLKVIIAPNPVKDVLKIKVDYELADHILVSLYEASGKFLGIILRDDVSKAGKKNYTLDFKYPKGNYLVNIHSNLGRQSIKIIKE